MTFPFFDPTRMFGMGGGQDPWNTVVQASGSPVSRSAETGNITGISPGMAQGVGAGASTLGQGFGQDQKALAEAHAAGMKATQAPQGAFAAPQATYSAVPQFQRKQWWT